MLPDAYFGYFSSLAVVMVATAEARAQGSSNAQASDAAVAGQAAPVFYVNAAVETYLAKMPPAERARSNAYFEGGYWLQLWDFLSTVVVMWLLLRFRLSMRMRDFAERITRFRPLQTAIYWLQFIVVLTRGDVSAYDLRRLYSRTQVWPVEPNLWSVDARPGGSAGRGHSSWVRF